jgi:uncharacterized protein YcfL
MKMWIILILIVSVLIVGCSDQTIIPLPPSQFDISGLECGEKSYCHLSEQDSVLYFNFTSLENGSSFDYRVE